MKIPFNKPYLAGKELFYIAQSVLNGRISGNQEFSHSCQKYFQDRFGFKKCLLTTSCTDALEMTAILSGIGPDDEVILPSYTFVSTANPFVMRGAKLVLADSCNDFPNIDVDKLESLITKRTKAIVIVHYSGAACDMKPLMELCDKYDLFLIEDAAQAIDSYYEGRALGSFGHLACFSFHETKNISAGEGGMLVINDERFIERAEIIWEKGTNRTAFFKGRVNKYEWVDIGSSYLPSDMIAAYLYAQLENLDAIQTRRVNLWNYYYDRLKILESIGVFLPSLPSYSTNNGHIFFIMCRSFNEREELLTYLRNKEISAVFHYIALHLSPFYKEIGIETNLRNAEKFTNRLLRLPLYIELDETAQNRVIDEILEFYRLVK